MRKLFLVAVLGWCAPAFAENCWEYKVIDTTANEKLTITADKRNTARKGLRDNLNRLGQNKWDLVSQHEIRVVNLPVPEHEGSGNRWHAELIPSVALFKRPTACN